MSDAKPPFEIDLVEVLACTGDVPMGIARQMEPDARHMWAALVSMVAARTAAVWVTRGGDSGDWRKLELWELEAVLRVRVEGSSEPAPPDEWLIIRPAERTQESYKRDFGGWLDKGLGAG